MRCFPRCLLVSLLLFVTSVSYAGIALVVDGVTMVPLVEVINATNGFSDRARVEQVAGTRQFKITKEETKFTLLVTLDSTAGKRNNAAITLAAAPFKLNGIVYVPLQFFSSTMGIKVDLNAKRDLIKLTNPNAGTMVMLGTGEEISPPSASLITVRLTRAQLTLRRMPVNKSQVVALFRAVCQGDTATINTLVTAHPALLYAKDSVHDQAIHVAARAGRTEVITLLLAKGASVRDRGNRAGTPLHAVASGGTVTIMSSDNIDEGIHYGGYIVPSSEQVSATVNLLLAKGADINAVNEAGETPLHCALGPFFSNEAAVETLLTKGADLQVRDLRGYSPLFTAAGADAVTGVKLLLAHGAKIDERNDNGEMAIHHAANHGRLSIVGYLLKHGAGVNAKDRKGNTPLYYAVSGMRNEALIEFLLQNGADINNKNTAGRTALAEIVCVQGSVTPPLVDLLLANNADVNAMDSEGNSVLLLAVQHGFNVKVVASLLEKGAQVNAKDQEGYTPLHYAARGQLDIVKLLVEHGADLSAKATDNTTPLDIAKRRGQKDIINYLTTRVTK